MRKNLLYLLGAYVLLLFYSCDPDDSQDRPVLTGYFEGINDSLVILEKFGLDKMEFIAQVPVVNDSFLFYTKLEKKTSYQIRMGALIVPLVYEGKPITITASQPKLSAIKVSGSDATSELLAFIDKVEKINSQIGTFKLMADSLSNSTGQDSLLQVVRMQIETSESDLHLLIREYLNEAEYFSLALIGINYLNPMHDRQYLDSLVNTFPKRFPNNNEADSFRKIVVTNIAQLNNSGINVGDKAPDFTLKNTDGTSITLSSTKGKYVFLDFWASFCAPCRAESIHKVKLSQDYSDENFTIFSVSLDADNNKWQAAIQKDSLSWINLREPDSWNSKLIEMYKIEKMPFNYLLDTNGVIIAKNMSIEELRRRLDELFEVEMSSHSH